MISALGIQHRVEFESGIMVSSLNGTMRRLLALCRLDRVWVRGQGAWLFDAQGRRFLDCYAQYGAVVLGHNAPSLVAAVREALDAGEPAMVQPYRAPHAEALAAALSRCAPGNLSNCIFTTSGAETIEVAIKLVRSRTRRPKILSALGSFHGKTLGALAATGQDHHSEGVGPLPPGFERIPFGDADSLEQRLRREASQIAAVLLEPIQGERGVYLPPRGYLSAVRDLCSRYEVPMVVDEIQTGLGRTGRLFACEHENVAPDVLLLAKALGGGIFPLGACLANDAVWDERFALRHSSTFANNNLACRVGCAVLDALIQGGLCQQVAQRGERLLEGLRALARCYPRVIANVRGRGLMAALELQPATDDHGAFLGTLQQHGLYAYTVAATIAETGSILVMPTLGVGNTLRIAPPLVISDDQIQQALDALNAVCAQLERNPAETIVRSIGALDDLSGAASETNGRSGRKPIVLPPPALAAREAPRPQYAFVVHPTCLDDLTKVNPGFRHFSRAELGAFSRFLGQLPSAAMLRAPSIRSATGTVAEGWILLVPLLPEAMARRGIKSVSREIAGAVDLAGSLGAQVVGLGAYTVPYTRRGLDVLGRGPAITTGNALTAGMSFAAVHQAAADRSLSLEDAVVAVVGATGSTGSLCARLFARARPRRMLLVTRPRTDRSRLLCLKQELECQVPDIELTAGDTGLDHCHIVLTATARNGPALERADLSPGTIICDVARPPDTPPHVRNRPDLMILEGGLVALPDTTTQFGPGNLGAGPAGIQLACLAETVLLSLEGDFRDHGVGFDVSLDTVDYMMGLAQRHGFRLAPSLVNGTTNQFTPAKNSRDLTAVSVVRVNAVQPIS